MFNKILAVSVLGFGLSFSNLFAVEVGQDAPCVVLDNLEKGTEKKECIRETVDKQHMYTVLEFFSIYCGACQKNLPIVQALAKDVGQKMTFRLVSIDDDKMKVKEYVTKKSIDFPVALDLEQSAKKAYAIDQTPTLVILDKAFKVVFRHEGVLMDKDVMNIKNLAK